MQYEFSYPEAMQIIGGLSNTSKMPWFSWSISAYDCITGTKLREVEGSVCSNCYACKGCYVFSSVRNAHMKRKEALDDPRFVDAFVFVLEKLYERTRSKYIRDGREVKENRFRWHDSGDLQSVEHMRQINEIANRTPFIDHWLPTKENGILKDFLKKYKNELAPNLNVRISHPLVGGTFSRPPKADGKAFTFSTVDVANAPQDCPAPQQGGKCGDCRNCWRADVQAVNYKQH